jgi:hypothetical protein
MYTRICHIYIYIYIWLDMPKSIRIYLRIGRCHDQSPINRIGVIPSVGIIDDGLSGYPSRAMSLAYVFPFGFHSHLKEHRMYMHMTCNRTNRSTKDSEACYLWVESVDNPISNNQIVLAPGLGVSNTVKASNFRPFVDY